MRRCLGARRPSTSRRIFSRAGEVGNGRSGVRGRAGASSEWAQAGSAVCGTGGAYESLLMASSENRHGVGDGSESLQGRDEREVEGEVGELYTGVPSNTFIRRGS